MSYNPANLTSLFNLAALAALLPANIANGSQISVANYSVAGDRGGGSFIWSPASVAQPDLGMTLCPNVNQASASGVVIGSGAGSVTTQSTSSDTPAGNTIAMLTSGVTVGQVITGTNIPQNSLVQSISAGVSVLFSRYLSGDLPVASTVTFSAPFTFTLPNTLIMPGTLQISAGLSGIITDDGAGNLLLGGLPIGSVNLSTGAGTINAVIANGQSVTAAYSYASTPGRWIRAFAGSVNLLWFGGVAGGACAAPLQAAINFAAAHSNSGSNRFVAVVCPANQGSPYQLAYSVNTGGANVNLRCNDGTAVFNLAYVTAMGDLYPAIILNTSVPEYISVTSTGSLWSGNLSTLATNGAINTTTLGDLSLYTTSPPYSAFAPGPVGFAAGATFSNSNKPQMHNCTTFGALKFGYVINNGNGHNVTVDCNLFGALAGVYVQCNGQTYLFDRGGLTGTFCAVMFGDTLVSGSFGGIGGFTYFRGFDFGFCPYAFFQVHDSPVPVTQAGGLTTVFFDTAGGESIGEAFVRQLPNSQFGPEFINVTGPSYSSGFNLPSQFTMSQGHGNFAFWCGFIQQFVWQGFGTISFGKSTVANALNGTLICQGYLSNSYTGIQGVPLRPQDLTALGSPLNASGGIGGLVLVDNTGAVLTNAQLSSKYPNFLNSQSRSIDATKDLAQIASGILPAGNLIKNPEVQANWTGTNTTVTVQSYASLLASPPAGFTSAQLAAVLWAPDQNQQISPALLTNPNVIVLTAGSSGNILASVPFLGNPSSIPHPINVGYDVWVFCGNGSNIAVNIALLVGSSTSMYSINANLSINNGWFKIREYGSNAFQNSSAANDNYRTFQVSVTGIGAGNSIILMNPMVFANEISPYNPNPVPALRQALAFAEYTVATLPTGMPSGSRAVVTDATAPTFLGALTGGGTVTCPVIFNGSAWVAG